MLSDIAGFLKKYKSSILIAMLFVLLCYGFMLTHYTLQIDEETWIKNSDPQLIKTIWISQGRFGLYIFDRIFSPLGRYIPILWDILAVIIYFFSGFIFLFSFSHIKKDFSKFAAFTFLCVFPALPFVTGDFLSFSMFNFQQALAMLVMSISFLCTIIYFRGKKKRHICLSIIFAFISVSFFQAFAVVYVTAVTAYFLLALLSGKYKKKEIVKNTLYSFIIFIVFITMYFVVNIILNNIYSLSNAPHASGYIGWSDNIKDNFLYTLLGAGKVILGYDIIGGTAILITEAVFIALSVILVIKQKGTVNRLFLGAAFLIFFISPFLMNFALLNWRFLGRILLAFSLTLALELFLFADYASKLKWSKILSYVIVCIILLINAGSMNMLFYNNYLSYKADKELAASIIAELKEKHINYESVPILFVGHTESATKAGDYVQSSSFFNWDEGNNNRMHDFFKAEGYTTVKTPNELKTLGIELSKDMPCWPSHESVKSFDSLIIVKFSDPSDKWFIINGVDK